MQTARLQKEAEEPCRRQVQWYDQASPCRPHALGLSPNVMDDDKEAGLPDLGQDVTPRLGPNRWQPSEVGLLCTNECDRFRLESYRPVIRTAPVSSKRLSSQVWPTTTNSSGIFAAATIRAHCNRLA